MSLYDTVDADGGAPLATPAVATIFGSAFLQNGRPGVAAYHFDGPDDCYISYASAPDAWRLDSGEKLPARKPFEAPRWDAATRTFVGAIDWSAAPFGGDARWEYTIIFSEDFGTVTGGEVRASTPTAGGSTHTGARRRTARRAFVAEIAQLATSSFPRRGSGD